MKTYDIFLGWFDDSKNLTTTQKISEAITAYIKRFKKTPNVVVVNEADRASLANPELVEGVAVRSESYMVPNNFWVGREE
ncbi:MAG: hypothetical protein GFH27_549323n9 [Chloroflexi bacterium AL-W]|nr:hypothetical protein [Chloroflexi bacterium AL-N1]NOK70160.1 hypothetical protein [Chloroflexi bacterium AL-N10]NOK77697.1 hypothetical protein [Chloroflexi bacterium AL-N5]NOK84706.1 hypothetical protein [Chloroflexi bacterium AL-W]NOK93231.1 hypothetical protein [Chloroflexi bacterium AL-N15]